MENGSDHQASIEIAKGSAVKPQLLLQGQLIEV